MAKRSLGQKIKCCSQEDRNAGFKSSTLKVKIVTAEHTSADHTGRHDLSGGGS